MKVNKSVNSFLDEKYSYTGTPNDEDYSVLKENFIKGDIDRDKIFVYSAKACDNMIDRSSECFSEKALKSISELIVGSPCLEDHYRGIESQFGRVYKAELVIDKDRQNDFGEPYKYVVAYCYTINNDKNKYIIEDILAGIRKSVSVGCSVTNERCSICGSTSYGCGHIRGNEYGGKKCASILDDVDDFYELSMVTVPCQREAGIIKNYNKEENTMDLSKALLDIGKLPGVNPEAVTAISKALEDLDNSALGLKVKSLETELTQKSLRIKELEEELDEMKMQDIIGKALSDLKPVSDEARELACKIVSDSLTKEDDEYVIPEDMRDILVNKYGFLFEKEATEDEDVEKEEDIIEEEEKEKKYNKSADKFTRQTVQKSNSIISKRTLAGIKRSEYK